MRTKKETSKVIAKQISNNLAPTKSAQISKLEKASNLVNSEAQSVNDVNGGLTTMQLKSGANRFLKREHNSLNSVLRTIKENFNNVAVQDYIKALQGKNLSISESDFEYNEVIQMLLYYTDENGKKVYSRLAKIKEEEEAQITYGDYSVQTGDTVNVEEHKSIDILVNNTHTLKAIENFSIWFILTLVVKVAKIEALSKKRATRLFNREISVYAKEHGLKVKESQNYCADNNITDIDAFASALQDAKVFDALRFEKKAK